MWRTGLWMGMALLSLTACAAPGDHSGIRVVQRTPEEFCRGSGRSIAEERYAMKTKGVPLHKALEEDGGTAVVNAITKGVYSRDFKSRAEAVDAGMAACLGYFR